MSGIFPPTTEPLGERVQEHQARKGGNVHAISKELEVQDSDVDSLPASMREAKEELSRAAIRKEKAEAALRQQIQHQTTFKNQLYEIQVLKSEIETAQLALAEYQFTIQNSTVTFSTWPFWTKQSGNRFGSAMRDFATSTMTAKELIPLLEPWIKNAHVRLADAIRKGEQFRKEHKLE